MSPEPHEHGLHDKRSVNLPQKTPLVVRGRTACPGVPLRKYPGEWLHTRFPNAGVYKADFFVRLPSQPTCFVLGLHLHGKSIRDSNSRFVEMIFQPLDTSAPCGSFSPT